MGENPVKMDQVNASLKQIGTGVLDLFKPLHSNHPNDNIDGTVALLEYFARNDVVSSILSMNDNFQ